MQDLHKTNVMFAALHGLSAFAVAFIFAENNNPRTIDLYRGSIPTDVVYPEINCNGNDNVSCPQKYTPKPVDRCKTISFPLVCKNVISADPGLLLFIFFAITAFAHLLYAMDMNKFYSSVIKQGWNPYRWIEYALSASTMAFLISILDNERNLNAATLIATMTGITQYQGYIVENSFLLKDLTSVQSEIVARTIKYATLSGWLLFLGVWYVLIKNFIDSLNDAKNITLQPQDKKIKIPFWVYGVVFTQAINFALFGLVQRRQINDHKQGIVTSYIKYEKQYIALSFSAKFILGAFVTYGIVNRTSGNDC